MPTLDQHQSSSYAKLIYIGDSGTGKTGSLASLLADGYQLKILDTDNGLDALVNYGKAAGASLANVEFETIRDQYRASPGGLVIKGQPKAFLKSLETLTKWSEIDDDRTIFVLDALDTFGKSAFEWAKGMNPTAKDPRQWYFSAQQAVENVLAMLTGDDFRMNVIIISHINYKEIQEGVHKGHVSAIGSALGPSIPKYFNTLILAEAQGSGSNVRRKIKTVPTGVIDLKIPIPQADKEYPLETGLATIFRALKGNINA